MASTGALLLIARDELFRSAYQRALELHGYLVVAIADSRSAGQVLETVPFDAIIVHDDNQEAELIATIAARTPIVSIEGGDSIARTIQRVLGERSREHARLN